MLALLFATIWFTPYGHGGTQSGDVVVRIASRHPGAPAPSVPLHRAVLEAIRRRDAEGAHSAMMALLDRTARNVERNVRPRAQRKRR